MIIEERDRIRHLRNVHFGCCCYVGSGLLVVVKCPLIIDEIKHEDLVDLLEFSRLKMVGSHRNTLCWSGVLMD